MVYEAASDVGLPRPKYFIST